MNTKTPLKFALGALLLAGGMNIATAGGQGGINAATIDQLSLANKLISMGDARNDPLLLIAGAKLQKTVSNAATRPSQKSFKTSDVLARAKAMAKGRKDLNGLADDVADMTSKGSRTYNYSNGYYTGTTYR